MTLPGALKSLFSQLNIFFTKTKKQMKVRKLTPTKAKLPDNERIIGGENNKLIANNNLKAIEKQAQKFLKNAKK